MTISKPNIDHYAVFGNPIEHSKSPPMQLAFAQQSRESMEYSAQCIPLNQFDSSVREFFEKGGKGLNITVPFKQKAFELAEVLTPRAQRAGAVNTLYLDEKRQLVGDNTDGIGLITDIIDRLNWQVRDKNILILGAGGAVRGVLQPIIEQKPATITIANRTIEKARILAKLFIDYYPIQISAYEDLPQHPFDVVINATSASLSGDLPPVTEKIIDENTHCYDMVYSKEKTPFLKWAEIHGARHLSDGLGMLVGQGAESFSVWRGQRPDVQPVIQMIREIL